MKGALGSPVAAAASAAMQESFGCVVANRFHQLLDDESDPFDILREAERRRQQQLQRKRRDEAAAEAVTVAGAAAGSRGGVRSPAGASGHRPGAGGVRRESQKERKSLPAPGLQQPDSPGGGPQPLGTHGPPVWEKEVAPLPSPDHGGAGVPRSRRKATVGPLEGGAEGEAALGSPRCSGGERGRKEGGLLPTLG